MENIETRDSIKSKFPDLPSESGYLIIETEYLDSTGEPVAGANDATLIEANAEIAWAVRQIVESKGSPIRGAVVKLDGKICVIVSLAAHIADWQANPLENVKIQINENLNSPKSISTNSSVRVKDITIAKKQDPETSTGLQGPP